MCPCNQERENGTKCVYESNRIRRPSASSKLLFKTTAFLSRPSRVHTEDEVKMSQNVKYINQFKKSNQIRKQIKSFKPSPSSCSLTEKGPTAREYVLEPESYPFSSNDRLLLPFPPAGGVVQLLQRSSQMEPFPLLRQTRTSQKKKTRLLAELSIRKALRWKS